MTQAESRFKTWQKTKLKDLGRVVTGTTPPTAQKDYFGVDFPFITPTDITDFNVRYNYETERFLSNKWNAAAKKTLIPKNSTCFVCIGSTIGKVCLTKENSFTNQQINTIVANPQKADFKYIYYLLKKNQDDIIKQYGGSGSGKAIINKSTFENIEFLIPNNIDEQKRIADILSAFDNKIELNNKINQNLEQMAQAIFKEWFVKNPESENWKKEKLNSLFNFIGGAQPPKAEHIYESRDGYVRFIQNRDYSDDSHKTYIKISNKNKTCNEYDIMVDKYGEVGVVRFGITGAYNVALAKLEPVKPFYREFLRFYFLQDNIQKIIESTAIASTRGSLNQNTFIGMEILLPSDGLLKKFGIISLGIIDKIMFNKRENQKLASLRDLLLPKLISGEIKLQ